MRSCRRRPRRDWRSAPVARIFLIPDEYHLLPASAARLKILQHLERLRMHPRTFFQSFDVDSDGHLTAVELYHGLTHLNVPIEEKEVHALIALLDTDRDQRISLVEWTAMFHLSAEDDLLQTDNILFEGNAMISVADLPAVDEVVGGESSRPDDVLDGETDLSVLPAALVPNRACRSCRLPPSCSRGAAVSEPAFGKAP